MELILNATHRIPVHLIEDATAYIAVTVVHFPVIGAHATALWIVPPVSAVANEAEDPTIKTAATREGYKAGFI